MNNEIIYTFLGHNSQQWNIILPFATSLTAIIGVIIAVLTLRQNSKMVEESTRPTVVIYTDAINPGNLQCFIIIKNFGKSSAYIDKIDTNFKFQPGQIVRDEKFNNMNPLTALSGTMLAPNQSKLCNIIGHKFLSSDLIDISIKYHSSSNKKYNDTFSLNPIKDNPYPFIKDSTKGAEMRNISYALQEMLQKNL